MTGRDAARHGWAYALLQLLAAHDGQVTAVTWKHRIYTRPGDASHHHQLPWHDDIIVTGGRPADRQRFAAHLLELLHAFDDQWFYRGFVDDDMRLPTGRTGFQVTLSFTLDSDGLHQHTGPVTAL